MNSVLLEVKIWEEKDRIKRQKPLPRMPTHKRGEGTRPKPWRALHPHCGPHPLSRAKMKTLREMNQFQTKLMVPHLLCPAHGEGRTE